jgi:pilus assembly protein CpaC
MMRGNLKMTTTTPIHAPALVGVMAAALLVPWQASVAGDATFSQPMQSVQIVASDSVARQVLLGMGKSLVIDLPRDIKDVLVADPKIANVVVRSSRRAFIIGGDKVGATNVFFFDAAGKQMATLDISISRDVNIIRTAIRQIIPNADINVEAVGDGILLSGTVASQAEAQQAYDVASHFVQAGDGAFSNTAGSAGSGATLSMGSNAANGTGVGGSSAKIINAIVVRERDQIMLKVTVAEVERDVVKQLGINFTGSLGYGSNVVSFNNTNPFSSYGQSLTGSGITGTVKSVTATLQAMEQAGVIHTLAEPSLTAISGETATFMAGGEFPVLNGFSCSTAAGGGPSTCQPSIDFKKFGVSLNFTPVVLSAGRISLKVVTEVSDLSSQNSLTITEPGSNNTAVIPSIRTRRADTTVEIPSGGSLAMAGMIQDQTKHSVNGLPGLMELPILGPLFKSNDYVNQRTELVILVTPYVVRAVATKDLARPDDGFADPSDPSQVLLGKLNRIYGVGGPATPPPDSYSGKLGFILD